MFLSGTLAQNTYETQEGERRHRTEVHAQEVIFLDSNGNGGNGRSSGNGNGSREAAAGVADDQPF